MRLHPHLYEVNTQILRQRLSTKFLQSLSLDTIPDRQWQLIKEKGFDLIWLMGVWQRSQGSRQKAIIDPELRKKYDLALPGWTETDVVGSPYAIYSYSLDSRLGSPEDLGRLRSKLNQHGLSLILDFVPNHLAIDHPWICRHPEWFMQTCKTKAIASPEAYFTTDGKKYFAHGRDPHFPPWTDTVQVNFYSDGIRHALINELSKISEVADGVRCDMAMLAINEMFENLWGGIIGGPSRQRTEFWVDAISQIRKKRPSFIFLAEVYGGYEERLQQMGFDYTYDKKFYDKLCHSASSEIRDYLATDYHLQKHSARFIENHDEPRAADALGHKRSMAAAVILATSLGVRIFHDGQLEGKRIHLPLQLLREPKEEVNHEIERFYSRLLEVCNRPIFHIKEWNLLQSSPAWNGNETYSNLLSWFWRYANQYMIVVINYSPSEAQGRLKLPFYLPDSKYIDIRDELSGMIYASDRDDMEKNGLYIDLSAYGTHILHLETS